MKNLAIKILTAAWFVMQGICTYAQLSTHENPVSFSKNNLQEDEYQLFSRFFNIIFSDMPKPELLVYLYSDVDRLQRNIHKRGRSYEQEISDAYLADIQQGYFDFLRQQQDNKHQYIF